MLCFQSLAKHMALASYLLHKHDYYLLVFSKNVEKFQTLLIHLNIQVGHTISMLEVMENEKKIPPNKKKCT